MTVGLLSIATLATFNGGKFQVNPNFIAINSEFPFVDMVKNSGSWSANGAVTGTYSAPPNTLDVNGYPTSGTFVKQLSLPLPIEKAGDWLMMWTGGGPNTVMSAMSNTTTVSGSRNGANGTYRFSLTPGAGNKLTQFNVGVATTGASYSPVTQISVVNVNDLAAWQADPDAFTPEFRAAITGNNFGVVRFLNWQGSVFQGANEAMWTDWASRKTVGYNSYSGAEYRSNWWGGTPSNSGSGLDYTLTTSASPTYIFGNGAPVDKQIMHVQFSQDGTAISTSTATFSGNDILWSGHSFTGGEPIGVQKINNNLPTGLWTGQNYYVSATGLVAGTSFKISLTPGGSVISSFGTGATGNYSVTRLPTLNINGSGAAPIRYAYGDPLGSSNMPKSVDSNSNPIYGTLVYDVDLASWLKIGGDGTDGSTGLTNGVPIELMLKLCIKTGTHPWFVSSALALDPMTDFWPSCATYLKANTPSWMIPRFEGVNEEWNTANGFFGVRYGWNKAWLHWSGVQFGTNQWQGKVASTLGQAISTVYGGVPDGTKYQFINGCQMAAAYFTTGPTVTQNNERMTSATYVAQAAAAQTGYTKTAASLYCTHVCTASYYQPNLQNTLAELQTAIKYSSVDAFNPTQQMVDLNSYTDSVLGISVSGTSILTLGSPGTLSWTSHGLTANQTIILYTTGALPTGLSTRVLYYVKVIDANTLQLALTSGGTAINFTGSQSGTQTAVFANINSADLSIIVASFDAYARWAAGFTNNASNPVGMTAYEGMWGDTVTSLNDASASVSAVTQFTNCVVTVGANTTLASGSSVTGVAAIIGGAVSFTSIGGMTALNTATFSPSFTGGSANITGVNTLITNQAVAFKRTSGNAFGIPPEVIEGVPYYVVSPGNPFQISQTRGGTPITFATTQGSFGINAVPGWFVTNVSGQNITLDVDSTGFGAYTSGGTLTYTLSAIQTATLRINGRLASNLQGYIFGNTTPIPSMLLSFKNIGVVYPSKFQLSGFGDPWGGLQPNIFVTPPTTGEWPAIVNFA